MAQIHVLSPHVANQIAAGEVVERPASVVKELVENALDAGARSITVELVNGGLDLIRVSDDGKGIAPEDCRTAFLRHATSKIATSEDLTHIVTLGFRGEALASIAAVAEVTMRTRMKDAECGTLLRISAGEVQEEAPCACTAGTTLEVRNLFANVPARLKFLKTVRTEAGYVGDYVSRMIMAVPSAAFHFVHNGKTVYRSFGDGKLQNAMLCVYGAEILPHLREVAFDDGYLAIHGYVGTEQLSRPNRLQQSFFLNGRYIRSYSLSSALQRAFDTRMMVGRFPFAVLAMRIAGSEVDVNVHPSKMEVRFVDEQRVIRSVTAACHRSLLLAPKAEETKDLSAADVPSPAPHAPSYADPGQAIDLRRPVRLQRLPSVNRGNIGRALTAIRRCSGRLHSGQMLRRCILPGRPMSRSSQKMMRPCCRERSCVWLLPCHTRFLELRFKRIGSYSRGKHSFSLTSMRRMSGVYTNC